MKEMKIDQLPQEIQRLGDGLSIGAVVGAFLGWLPHIATALTIIWMIIRITETQRFRQFIHWIKNRHKK